MSESYFDRIRNVYVKLNNMFFKYENEVLGALMATYPGKTTYWLVHQVPQRQHWYTHCLSY
ncbi:hypothetical protein [Vulcanisaeta distributa]|uniref:hypothetical protein n=1 Tax=Vulcanisaeta distributa TaxID=164451 RepID=UPI001FB46A76|nr:hypothetical protein [Vulcanisaeta distributa]